MKVPQKFTTHVLERESVTVGELVRELDLKELTVRNYLSRMKREGLLVRVGRGRYTVDRGVRQAPDVPDALERILHMISREFPQLNPVAWSSSMISDFTHNVPGRDLYVIDTPRNAVERLAHYLTARDVLVFKDPGPDSLDAFAWSNLEAVFLFGKGETTASVPLDDYRLATVDRIWVDLYFLSTRRGLSFPLAELGVVLMNAYRSGVISVDRMLMYSSRRGLRPEVLVILYELGKVDPDLGILGNVLPYGDRAPDWIEQVVIGASEGW
jgi:hypothetical protein